MNPQSIAQWLNTLSVAERAKALNLIGFRLTIHAREYGLESTGDEHSSSAARKLLGINELQHKLISQIGHYLDGGEDKSYPVDVLCQILTQMAGQYGISNILAAAIGYAKGKTTA